MRSSPTSRMRSHLIQMPDLGEVWRGRSHESLIVCPILASFTLGKGEVTGIIGSLLPRRFGYFDRAHGVAPRRIAEGDDAEDGGEERPRAVDSGFPLAGAAVDDVRHLACEP